jgi:mycothiol synthase
MARPHLRDLPPLIVPDGFAIRTWRDGDEIAWGAIMDPPGAIPILGGWTPQAVRTRHVDHPSFRPEWTFLVVPINDPDGTPIASATSWREVGAQPGHGAIHMVAALSAWRGRGLGRAVTLAAMHALAARGDVTATLKTDDWRIAAIRTYLGLGLLPVWRPDGDGHSLGADHRDRWSAVMQACFAGRPQRAAITP